MSDSTASIVSSTYRELINEVFIAPIRTAVVVDDEYPTLDELLTDQDPAQDTYQADQQLKSKKDSNRSAVRDIINVCRTQSPTPWLVDVHDGRSPSLEKEEEGASHLDHSDLLILDYHLESGSSGKKAIEILQRLAGNGHFNLVVVYTREQDEPGTGIDRTINEIALGLTFPVPSLIFNSNYVSFLENKFFPWEERQSTIYTDLLDALDLSAFLKAYKQKSISWDSLRETLEFRSLATYLDNIPSDILLDPNEAVKLLMHKKHSDLRDKMAKEQYGCVTTNESGERGVNWIRTDSLFITVISKNHPPSTIPERLLDALVAWDPTPHRLILSKIRTEIGQHGIAAEADVLSNRYLQAGWLEEILENDKAKRGTNVRLDVSRHWEILGGKIGPNVVEYTERLATYLSLLDSSDVRRRFDPDSDYKLHGKDISLQLNCYACSKPVEGHHLSTGQILKIDRGSQGFEYWLCLTPACDLVPGQGDNKGWKKNLESWLPFKAVRLYCDNEMEALKTATNGHHLFLPIDQQVKVFSFSERAADQIVSLQSLRWEQYFAANKGIFNSSNQLQIGCIISTDGKLTQNDLDSVIVAQLRYEYALNLMQRLGLQLSRIGLDFSSYVLN
jgi:hypothetical protein